MAKAKKEKKFKKSGSKCKHLAHAISTAKGKHARGKALGNYAKHCRR